MFLPSKSSPLGRRKTNFLDFFLKNIWGLSGGDVILFPGSGELLCPVWNEKGRLLDGWASGSVFCDLNNLDAVWKSIVWSGSPPSGLPVKPVSPWLDSRALGWLDWYPVISGWLDWFLVIPGWLIDRFPVISSQLLVYWTFLCPGTSLLDWLVSSGILISGRLVSDSLHESPACKCDCLTADCLVNAGCPTGEGTLHPSCLLNPFLPSVLSWISWVDPDFTPCLVNPLAMLEISLIQFDMDESQQCNLLVMLHDFLLHPFSGGSVITSLIVYLNNDHLQLHFTLITLTRNY